MSPNDSEVPDPGSGPPTSAEGDEVIGVRHGLFGAHGSGDTSGYGGLVRKIVLSASTRPYGSYFDDIADTLSAALGLQDGASVYDQAIEKVEIHADEMTLYVRARWLPVVAATLRDDPALRFELCLGVNGVHYPDATGRELHAVYPLTSITHNRRL